MSKKKKNKEEKRGGALAKEIEKLVSGLYYISETDSEIFPFVGGKAGGVTKEIVLKQTKSEPDSEIEERNFEEFFSRLTKIEDWFGEEEIEAARKFAALKELLQKKLRDLKVFKIGQIELDIYAVGLDSENVLMGIKTKAVET
jgi:hypothetical protein